MNTESLVKITGVRSMQSTIEATENGECKTNTWDQRHSPQMHSSEQPALPEKFFFQRHRALCVL